MTFVRTDSDKGWGFICVGAPDDLSTSAKNAFVGSPALLGPLWLAKGDEFVFGVGWAS